MLRGDRSDLHTPRTKMRPPHRRSVYSRSLSQGRTSRENIPKWDMSKRHIPSALSGIVHAQKRSQSRLPKIQELSALTARGRRTLTEGCGQGAGGSSVIREQIRVGRAAAGRNRTEKGMCSVGDVAGDLHASPGQAAVFLNHSTCQGASLRLQMSRPHVDLLTPLKTLPHHLLRLSLGTMVPY